jgi:hypothetical protein
MVNVNSRTIALAIAVLATSAASAASAQDNVILFGDPDIGQSDVSFQYNPATNTAFNFNTDYLPTLTCASGLPETWTVTSISLVQDTLSVGGTVSLAGCASEMVFGGSVILDPPLLSEGNGGAEFLPASVPEPGTGALLVLGLLSLASRGALRGFPLRAAVGARA